MYDEKGMIDNDDANDSLPKATCKITDEHVQECRNKFKGTSWIDSVGGPRNNNCNRC